MTRYFKLIIILTTSIISCARAQKTYPPHDIGAWVVYWDGERGLTELANYGRLFDRASLFAYELDPQLIPRKAPHFDELMPRFLSLSKDCGFSPWVTIVNDIRSPNEVVLKGTGLLRQGLTDPVAMKGHVRSIVEKVREDGFAGIDLDYEGLLSSDQAIFDALVEELSAELKRFGLGLNVIVGPRKGPLPPPGTSTLTVMGYNLHGPHGKPGPRATPEFIASLGERGMRTADGPSRMALATGGFAWTPDGNVRQLDWSDAKAAAAQAKKQGRGEYDHVPYAVLEDGTELWFDDAESIREKWDAASKAGYRSLMIWRLGGNDDTLFQLLIAYRNNTKVKKRE